MTTRQEAKDIMFGHLQAATPTGVVILWPDTPQDIPVGQRWLRPVVRHATGGQMSLSNESGSRKFTHAGVLIVQVAAPVGDGTSKLDELVQTLQTYFETIGSSQVWYRNIRALEIGKDGSAEIVNFMADFSYDIHH